jgi:hypothetical protein
MHGRRRMRGRTQTNLRSEENGGLEPGSVSCVGVDSEQSRSELVKINIASSISVGHVEISFTYIE